VIDGSRMKYDQVFVPFLSRPVSSTSGVPEPSDLIRNRLGTARVYVRITPPDGHLPFSVATRTK
jgi:hypothetical protein